MRQTVVCGGLLKRNTAASRLRSSPVSVNLPPRQRNVIAARYEGDKTIAEIAADMDISRQAVFKSLKIAPVKN